MRSQYMANWFNRFFGFNTAAVTPNVTAPIGKEFASIGIKADTMSYPFESSKEAVEYIKGTVSACLTARASERSVIRFLVLEGGKETTRSRQIQKCLDLPNPVQSRIDFMEEASHFHDATGNAVIYFVNGRDRLPTEMWLIPSFYVTAIFNKPSDPVPSAWRWADGRVVVENGNICFVRQNSVKTAPYTGRGFLGEQIDNAILYDMIVTSQKNFFLRGGAPNVALQAPEGLILTPENTAEYQKSWNARYNPATGTSNVAILPDGLKAVNFGPQEINFVQSKEEVRDAIREGLQVPKMILGDTDNVNHNNGQTALAMFERLIILRWAQKFANALECHFKRAYHSTITVELDPKMVQGFTQLPTNNGVITTPEPSDFLSPTDPRG